MCVRTCFGFDFGFRFGIIFKFGFGGGFDFDGRGMSVRVDERRFGGHDDVRLFLDAGGRAEEVFQHGDLHQERDADGLFDVIFLDIGGEELFGLESERELAADSGGPAG